MASDPISYTPAELMVAAAARQIENGEIVFVGMRLPLLGFLLAKCTHAADAVGIYELGVVRDDPAPAPLVTMGDLPNLTGASWLGEMTDAMGILQQGHVDLSFIGGAQIDRFGNLNTSYIGRPPDVTIRLPGSGGACDLACLAQRHVVIMAHEKRRFVPRVDYITSPGYGDGHQWRERNGLNRGGPAAVITTLGIFGFDATSKEMVLTAVHPGVTAQQVCDQTGWPLKVAANLEHTKCPTAAELRILRRFDPEGYWTGHRDSQA